MTCTRPQAESQKNPLTRGRRPHMTQSARKPNETAPITSQRFDDTNVTF
ncbi:MAG: hypothetical protein QOE78_2522, partial [Alphaproteobacteria bacterium]|nr:hypothetical protein [Alphaproteobacteria bacterium]